MKLAGCFKLSGNVKIEVKDTRTEKVLRTIRVKNLVTTVGRGLICGLLNGTADRPSHLASGTSSTAAALGDTALGNEVARISLTQTVISGNVITLSSYLPSALGNGSTLREAGIFNAASSGSLFARAVHSDVIKTSGITVSYTWQFTVTSS